MKTCTCCGRVKDLFEFSPQKTRPGKFYSWCDGCRETPVAPAFRPKASYFSEMAELKAKAAEKRAFKPDQLVELQSKFASGAKAKDLAAEYGCNTSSVYRALRGYK